MTDFRTPRKAAAGLGASKTGTGHFIDQRVTAIALVPLGIWFAVAAIAALESGYEGARGFIGDPVNAVLLILFAIVSFHHMRIGMQVVIEDYIARHGTRAALLILNTFAVWTLTAAAVFSILSIAL